MEPGHEVRPRTSAFIGVAVTAASRLPKRSLYDPSIFVFTDGLLHAVLHKVCYTVSLGARHMHHAHHGVETTNSLVHITIKHA